MQLNSDCSLSKGDVSLVECLACIIAQVRNRNPPEEKKKKLLRNIYAVKRCEETNPKY